jgi:hypothetical protein
MAENAHTPTENADVTKDVDTILAERETALRSALSTRSKVAVFITERDSHPVAKPSETVAPTALDSNDSNGAPLSIAYDLPLAQTFDFYVETSNYSVADILSSLETINQFAPNTMILSNTVQPAENTNTTTYAKFETDNLSNVVADSQFNISSRTDPDDKHHYLFENKNQSTYVVLFKVKENNMLKFNNLMMPLDRFLTLKQCVAVVLEKKTVKELDPHQDPTNMCMAVSCTFEDDSVVQIDNASVDLVMAIVSHLSAGVTAVPCEVDSLTDAPLPPSPALSPASTPPVSEGSDEDPESRSCWERFVSICCPRRRGPPSACAPLSTQASKRGH